MSATDGSKFPLRCLFFGSIGSLAHCSELQWRLFNQALQESVKAGSLRLDQSVSVSDIFWDKESYIASLVDTGGSKRLKTLFQAKKVTATDPENSESALEAVIRSIHQRKSELFTGEINAGGICLRPGIRELLRACKVAGVKTGFCTTTDKRVMEAFVKNLDLEDFFDVTISEESLAEYGNRKKPAPDCYWHIVKKMTGVDTAQNAAQDSDRSLRICAIEDTQISLASPVAAGIPSIAIPSEWAVGQDFSAAKLRVAKLAELVGDETGIVLDAPDNEFGRKALQAVAKACGFE